MCLVMKPAVEMVLISLARHHVPRLLILDSVLCEEVSVSDVSRNYSRVSQ